MVVVDVAIGCPTVRGPHRRPEYPVQGSSGARVAIKPVWSHFALSVAASKKKNIDQIQYRDFRNFQNIQVRDTENSYLSSEILELGLSSSGGYSQARRSARRIRRTKL